MPGRLFLHRPVAEAASDIAAWLNGSPDEVAPLMVPLQDGLLKVEEAVGVDWDAP